VPACAVLLSLRQQALYSAAADVLVSRANLASSLNGIQDPTLADANRVLQTQADIARTPIIAQRVLAALHLKDRTPHEFLGRSSVSPQSNADVLTFRVTDPAPSLATRLATEHA